MDSTSRLVLKIVFLVGILIFNPFDQSQDHVEKQMPKEIVSYFQWSSSDYHITKSKFLRSGSARNMVVNERIDFDKSDDYFLNKGYVVLDEYSGETQRIYAINGPVYAYQIFVRRDQITIVPLGSVYNGILFYFVMFMILFVILKEIYDINKVDKV